MSISTDRPGNPKRVPIERLNKLFMQQSVPESKIGAKDNIMDANILLLVSNHNRIGVRTFLEQAGLVVTSANDFRDAQRLLRGITCDLVLVEVEISDGSWQDLLEFILDAKIACEMIVCSRLGDERLWAEVIQSGAYNLIVEPYGQREFLRIVQGALDERQMQRMIRARQ